MLIKRLKDELSLASYSSPFIKSSSWMIYNSNKTSHWGTHWGVIALIMPTLGQINRKLLPNTKNHSLRAPQLKAVTSFSILSVLVNVSDLYYIAVHYHPGPIFCSKAHIFLLKPHIYWCAVKKHGINWTVKNNRQEDLSRNVLFFSSFIAADCLVNVLQECEIIKQYRNFCAWWRKVRELTSLSLCRALKNNKRQF